MPTITYKQLQDSWIRSDWVDSNTDDFGEDFGSQFESLEDIDFDNF